MNIKKLYPYKTKNSNLDWYEKRGSLHGIINSQYLTVCKRNNVTLDSSAKLGSKLSVSTEYFKKAYLCLYELSVKLTHVIWRKLLQSDLEEADLALNDVCYKLIQKENFELADILLHFATVTIKKHSNEVNKNVFIINKALSKYLAGEKDECFSIVKQKDWSASSLNFRLAVEVLSESYENALNLMDKIGTSDEVPRHAYQTWPLFSNFRKEESFQQKYKDIYKEDYKVIERPSPTISKLLERRGRIGSKRKPTKKRIARPKTKK